jgi:hypothetical protein
MQAVPSGTLRIRIDFLFEPPTMTVTSVPAPEWLTRRDGTLKLGIRPEILFVVLGGQPQYRLDIRPATGTFAASVTMTVNGKRLDDPAKHYASVAAAFTGGLEQLREKLGW